MYEVDAEPTLHFDLLPLIVKIQERLQVHFFTLKVTENNRSKHKRTSELTRLYNKAGSAAGPPFKDKKSLPHLLRLCNTFLDVRYVWVSF